VSIYDGVTGTTLEARRVALEARLYEAKIGRSDAEHRCHLLEGELQDIRMEVARRTLAVEK
jgi:hypothetical protein